VEHEHAEQCRAEDAQEPAEREQRATRVPPPAWVSNPQRKSTVSAPSRKTPVNAMMPTTQSC
jgi:hypothetical protein